MESVVTDFSNINKTDFENEILDFHAESSSRK